MIIAADIVDMVLASLTPAQQAASDRSLLTIFVRDQLKAGVVDQSTLVISGMQFARCN